MELFNQDPREFEEWGDIMFWKQKFDSFFKETTRRYFKDKISKVHESYFTDCINDKNFSEISGIIGLYDKDCFVGDEYEILALFVNNIKGEKFFILKKNNEYYGLDISKQYNDLFKY